MIFRTKKINQKGAWENGIYFNIRLSDDRPCILVLIGATQGGRKDFIGLHDGFRESKQSWKDCLQNLKPRGLTISGNRRWSSWPLRAIIF